MSDDTFSRLYEAGKEAAKPFSGVKPVIPWVVMGLTALGFGRASDWKLQMLLPSTGLGRAALIVSFFLAIAWPIAVAYRLKAEIRKLHEKYASLPEPERALIWELRTVAGEAIHPYTNILFAGSLRKSDIQNLHDLCGKLHRHKGIYSAGTSLAKHLSLLSMTHVTGNDFMELKIDKKLEEGYDRLLAECELVLNPSIGPGPSKASGQVPPSSRESSE